MTVILNIYTEIESVMSTGIFKRERDATLSMEGPFPAKILLSRDETPHVSVKIGKLSIGQEISIHSHKDVDQVEYFVKGKAMLFLDGVGEKRIEPGTFMYAPRGAKHGIQKVTEDVLILSVFLPALF